MSFMIPPDVRDLSSLRRRGAKVIVCPGVADPILSGDNRDAWAQAARYMGCGSLGLGCVAPHGRGH